MSGRHRSPGSHAAPGGRRYLLRLSPFSGLPPSGRPVLPVAPPQTLVLIDHSPQHRQQDRGRRIAVRLQLDGPGTGETLERRAELIARNQQLEPSRSPARKPSGRSDCREPKRQRRASPPRSRSRSSAPAPDGSRSRSPCRRQAERDRWAAALGGTARLRCAPQIELVSPHRLQHRSRKSAFAHPGGVAVCASAATRRTQRNSARQHRSQPRKRRMGERGRPARPVCRVRAARIPDLPATRQATGLGTAELREQAQPREATRAMRARAAWSKDASGPPHRRSAAIRPQHAFKRMTIVLSVERAHHSGECRWARAARYRPSSRFGLQAAPVRGPSSRRPCRACTRAGHSPGCPRPARLELVLAGEPREQRRWPP